MSSLVDPLVAKAYRQALERLTAAEVPFVVGGTWAVEHYVQLGRATLDLDLMLAPENVKPAAEIVKELGAFIKEETDLQLRLGVESGEIDLVHHFAMGRCAVDPSWRGRGVPGRLLDHSVVFASPADLIWTKVFIAARARFDGSDVVHLIRAAHDRINWDHLVEVLRPFPELLLAYLNLFQYCYPATRQAIPLSVWEPLRAAANQPPPPADRDLSRGPLLDHQSFEYDVTRAGFRAPAR